MSSGDGSRQTVRQPEPSPLQPVLKKPFPEGATDEQVCAAIANTSEQDLWRRFGHLVPLYISGSLLIVDATQKRLTEVESFIGEYHGRSYFPLLKACSHGKILVYVRGLTGYEPMDTREPGLPHLAQQITQHVGVPVPEYFGYFNDQQRLSDYCRADAELCEELVNLNHAYQGEGLCVTALSACRIEEGNPGYVRTLERCRRLPRKVLACYEYARVGSSVGDCRESIRSALCP